MSHHTQKKNMKVAIHVPVEKLTNPFFNHAGDTFRELVHCWQEAGLVTIVPTNDPYVWWNEVGDVVLYDRPTLEWWQRHTPATYKAALFGNTIPMGQEVPNAWPWIFWGRRPKMLQETAKAEIKTWQERTITSIFMGKIENSVQQNYRADAWASVIEEFHLVTGTSTTPYPFTQQQYLERLGCAKYGLCLRGYGPKCNREIELMALGTVPIVTPDVDMAGYFNVPQRDVHYFVATTPDDVTKIITTTPDHVWQFMSTMCREWYTRNASTFGSFYQTARLVSTIKTSAITKSIRTSWSVPMPKPIHMNRVVIDTVFFERPFSGISRVWQTLFNSLRRVLTTETFGDNANLEFVLLLRQNANGISPSLLQEFAFVGVPSFSYDKPLQDDVTMLDGVCKQLQADLFISTYYTYTKACDCMAVIHDMIPEMFAFPKNSMWQQKDQCIANAQSFMCVSKFAAETLAQHGGGGKPTFIVPNAFDESVFDGVDQTLLKLEDAKSIVTNELGVQFPFILVVASNTESYKNLRLVNEMIRINAEFFASAKITIVLVCNTAVGAPKSVSTRVLSRISDYHLGLLYGLAQALIYPSKCEGFGLPILEAFWSECPVICCKGRSGVTEVGGTDACFYVNPDDPRELFATIKQLLSGTLDPIVREKAKQGLKRLELFTPQQQLTLFLQTIKQLLKNNCTKQNTSMMQTANQPQSDQPTTASPTTASPSASPQSPPQPKELEEHQPNGHQPNEHLGVQSNGHQVVQPSEFNGVDVIVQYFIDAQNPDRQAEYDFCVQANFANPAVHTIHFLLEPDTIAPDWIAQNPKSVVSQVQTRLTYKQAFDYANAQLIGKTVALMNLDIFLDHATDWKTTKSLFEMSIVLCLSRHEFDGVETSSKDPRLQALAYANAQDCWVFRSPIWVKDCDFKMGMLGCDNAIAHRIKASGYVPINTPNEFKIHHFDVCRGKRGDNFMAHHKPNQEQPEERGYYLLPDYSALSRIKMIKKAPSTNPQQQDIETSVISIDEIVDRMGLGQIHRYRIICDIMSQYIKLDNNNTEAQNK